MSKKKNAGSSAPVAKTVPAVPAEKKENPVSGADFNESIGEEFDKFELWFIENGKLILAVCILLLLGVAAFYTAKYVIESKKSASIALFANADTPEKLEKAINSSSDSPQAVAGMMRLAALKLEKGDFKGAMALYSRASAASKDIYLARRAALQCAYLQEKMGKNAEAVKLYAKLADELSAPADIRAEAAYAAGRLFFNMKNMISARKYLTLFNETNSNPVVVQYVANCRALLNRMPAEKKVVKQAVKQAVKKPAVVKKPAAKAPAKAKKPAGK